jgi:hypothetical protein
MRKIIQYIKELRSQQGNSLVIFALFLPVLLGMAALVTDVGVSAVTKSKMQNAADAAAWAGVAYLPNNPGHAMLNGVLYSYYNGIPILNSNVSISTTYYTNDTIVVRPERTVNFGFGRVVGIDSNFIQVKAKAIIGNLSESAGVVPLGLMNNNPNPYTFGRGFGTLVTVRLYDGVTGDFQALSIDGPGASDYNNAIINGTNTTVAIGSVWEAKPGAMDGPTDQALETRAALDAALNGDCDTYAQVITPLGNDLFHVNNWNSKRLVIFPIVSGILGPRAPMTVVAFSAFFIETWGIQGNQLFITGYFVNTTIPTKRFTPYYGEWGTRVVKFAE